VVREGGVRELALDVRVPIGGIGSGGAHRGRLVAMKQVGGGNRQRQAEEEVEGTDSRFVEWR
jgi:hypothetical protein